MPRFFLSLVVLTSVSAATAAPTGLRLRLIVIDESGSMSGERIDDVRSDLLKYVQADPPSKRAPIGIVRFAQQATPTKWHTNQPSAEEDIRSIVANGAGTSIASGLQEALDQLKRYGTKASVELYLYTDDQDSTPEETERVVAELSQLFTSRKQKKLDQSVIVRTWSQTGAGSTIESILQKNPDVAVSHITGPIFVATRLAPQPNPIEHRLQLTAKPTGKVRWEDRSHNVAVYELAWTLSASTPSPAKQAEPFAAQLVGVENGSLAAAPVVINAATDRPSSGVCEVSVQLTDQERLAGKPQRALVLKATVDRHPTSIRFVATSVAARVSGLPALPRARTKIGVAIDAAEPGVWYETPNIAYYRIHARVHVDGPLPAGSKLQVQAPSGVTRLRITPETLESGEQRVELQLTAAVLPAPEAKDLEFRVEPPGATPLIEFAPIEPVRLQLDGPERLRVHGGRSSRPDVISGHRIEASTDAELPVCLWLQGPASRRFAEDCRFQITSDAIAAKVVDLPAYRSQKVRLTSTSTQTPSYFLDAVDSCSLEVSSTSPAVACGSLQAHVRTYAPFKLHLCVTLAVVAAVGITAGVTGLIRSLAGGEESLDPLGGDD